MSCLKETIGVSICSYRYGLGVTLGKHELALNINSKWIERVVLGFIVVVAVCGRSVSVSELYQNYHRDEKGEGCAGNFKL